MRRLIQGPEEVAHMSQKGGGSAGQAAMLRDALFQVYGVDSRQCLCCAVVSIHNDTL